MHADVSQYYCPDYELNVRPSNMDNANTAEYLEKIKIQVIENIRRTMHKPSVQLTEVPDGMPGTDVDEADAILDDADDDENPDARFTAHAWDRRTEKEGELMSDSEDDEALERNGVRRSRAGRRRNITDHRNPRAAPDDDEDELLDALEGQSVTLGAVANGLDAASSAAGSSRRSSAGSPATPAEAAVDNDVTMGDDDEDAAAAAPADSAAPASTTATATAVPAPASVATDGPQPVTPPDSPPDAPEPAAAAVTAAPAATQAPALFAEEDQEMPDADAGGEDKKEAAEATAEDPAEAQANGVAEREAEKSTAEQSKELAEEAEQA